MPYLLNLVYVILLVVASPWLAYAAINKQKYREGFAEKLLGQVPRRDGNRKCIWFHAVSVGEANLLATLIPRIERRHPDVDCVISVTTKTAYDMGRKKYAPRQVFYCPLDFSWAVRRAFARIRPDMLVLAELELWPNLIGQANQAGIPVALVNGRLSERSHRGYRRIRRLISATMRKLDLIAAQNDEYSKRFFDLGASDAAVQVTGSLKFDGAAADRDNPETRRLAALAGFCEDDLVLLAGSTQSPEEELALQVFQKLSPRFPELRLVLVPRHPDRFAEVAEMLRASGVPWVRRTDLGSNTELNARVLLVDTVGELGAWWGACHIAYVGGSMGTRGGQNMIEPAAYGAAVSFGPNTRNFRDVVSLMLEHQAARVVKDGDDLERFVRRCLTEPAYREEMGIKAQRLVQAHQGAAARTVELLCELLARHEEIGARRVAA